MSEVRENFNYQKLTKLQRDFVESLKRIGYQYKSNSTYEFENRYQIDVSKFSAWSEVLKHMQLTGRIMQVDLIKETLRIS